MESGRLWRCESCLAPKALWGISLGVGLLLAGVRGTTASGQGIDYVSPAIRGRAVAAETGRPLARVSVLAWWRDPRMPDSLLFANTLRAVEVESAEDGAFTIAAWEPKALRAPVSKDSPMLIFFIAGREPTYFDAGQLKSDHRSVEIRMRAHAADVEERAKKLTELLNIVLLVWAPLRDQPTPRMLTALDAEWQTLPAGLRKETPVLIPWFEWALRELRIGGGG